MEDLALAHPIWKRVWWWLTTGHARPARFGWFHELRAPTRWSRLASLYRIVMARRSMHPVPLLYVMVIGLGLVIGVVAQVTLRFPWWIPPLALFVIAWLFFFSTIWWPRRVIHSTPLREDILRVTNPMRSRELQFDREAGELRATPILLLHPLELEGLLPHLGWGRSGQHLESIELSYLNPDLRPEEAQNICEVKTTFVNSDRYANQEDRLRGYVQAAILGALMTERVSSKNAHESEEYFAQSIREANEIADRVTWSPATVRIDGAIYRAQTTSVLGLTFTGWEMGEQQVLLIDHGREGYTPVAPDFTEIVDREPLIARLRSAMRL